MKSPPTSTRASHDYQAIRRKLVKRPREWYPVIIGATWGVYMTLYKSKIAALHLEEGFKLQQRGARKDANGKRVVDVWMMYDPDSKLSEQDIIAARQARAEAAAAERRAAKERGQ